MDHIRTSEEIQKKSFFISKREWACYGIAFLALTISLPFYAFNRSGENPVSYHASAFFTSYFPTAFVAVCSDILSITKRFPILDDGFPSVLWCLAWTLVMLTVWNDANTKREERIAWCLLPVLLNFLFELFQHAGILAGHGSVVDGLSGCVGAFLALLIFCGIMNKRGNSWRQKEFCP